MGARKALILAGKQRGIAVSLPKQHRAPLDSCSIDDDNDDQTMTKRRRQASKGWVGFVVRA